VKRKSIIIPKIIFNFVIKNYPEIKVSNIELRIDESNSDKILSFLLAKDKRNKYLNIKKFARILREVLLGKNNKDLYDHEPPKGKNVTAMKFKGKQNIRIICKELFCGNKKIIMVTLFHKKSSKGNNISKKDLALYESIGDYDYEC